MEGIIKDQAKALQEASTDTDRANVTRTEDKTLDIEGHTKPSSSLLEGTPTSFTEMRFNKEYTDAVEVTWTRISRPNPLLPEEHCCTPDGENHEKMEATLKTVPNTPI